MPTMQSVQALMPRRHRFRTAKLLTTLSMIFALITVGIGVGAPPAQADPDVSYSQWAHSNGHVCHVPEGRQEAVDCLMSVQDNGPAQQLVMEVFDESTDTGTWMGTNRPYGRGNQIFSFHPRGDGAFQIKTNSGLCLMPGWWNSTHRIRPVEQQRCNGQEKWQYWYFSPIPGHTYGFMIRNIADDQCIDRASSGWLNLWPCHGSANQTWGSWFGAKGNDVTSNDFTRGWAAKYALTKCDASLAEHTTPYCSYNQSQVAVRGNDKEAAECLVAQHTDDPIPSTTRDFKTTNSRSTVTTDSIATGWKNTVTVKMGTSTAFWHVDVSAEVSQMITRSTQTGTTTSEEVTYRAVVPAAPAHSTTWVKAFPVTKTYTGKFIFAKGSWDEWTYTPETTITVTYPAGGGHTMMYDSGVAEDKLNDKGQWVRQPACVSDEPTETMDMVS
ncbi:RICIN domain-containing protein [Streptomyces virginiae]|uniref:RICIN domain-containing protein n=1 Tax=Streptomyces virginiae TaxID=1961 RepID=UPI00225219D1|nr:RICIN domain-containing protein [Streptomyces virginiae]MCX4721858.1 RICIN domain-containing protein [Streptomyces virginiae]